MKKLQAIVFLSIFYTFLIRADQEYPNPSPYPANVTITINAPTSTNAAQNNDNEQKAHHASQPTTHITTHINTDKAQSEDKDLKPNVSAVTYMARNAAKLAIIARLATWYPAFGAAYAVNRVIVQPLLGNGDIFEKISDEEKKEYAKNGLRKVPDIRFFPILHSMKKYFKL